MLETGNGLCRALRTLIKHLKTRRKLGRSEKFLKRWVVQDRRLVELNFSFDGVLLRS